MHIQGFFSFFFAFFRRAGGNNNNKIIIEDTQREMNMDLTPHGDTRTLTFFLPSFLSKADGKHGMLPIPGKGAGRYKTTRQNRKTWHLSARVSLSVSLNIKISIFIVSRLPFTFKSFLMKTDRLRHGVVVGLVFSYFVIQSLQIRPAQLLTRTRTHM